MKAGTIEKVKFSVLKSLLNVPRYQAIGILEGLWYFTSLNAPDGAIGRFSDLEITCWLEWPSASSSLLMECLISAGFIDECQANRLVIHDWPAHCPTYVKGNMAKHGKSFAVVTKQPAKQTANENTKDATKQPPKDATKGYTTKSSQVKSSQVKKAEPPKELDLEAWETWVAYRAQIKKPIKPPSVPAAQKQMAKFADRQREVVEHSIANGYQGLFAPNDKPNGKPKPNGNGMSHSFAGSTADAKPGESMEAYQRRKEAEQRRAQSETGDYQWVKQ